MSTNGQQRREILTRQPEQHLAEDGLLSLPVDLEALAKARDIVLQPMPATTNGVSGMLARHGNTFGILYSTAIRNRGFRRFCIAHEFGHYFIDGHLDHIPFDGNLHSSHAGFMSNNKYEREADHFAAGLLMPESLVLPILDREPDGLGTVEAVQQAADASLTASAIRYVGLAEIATAMVISRNGFVDYCFMSDLMRSFGSNWLRKGTPIPKDTMTAFIAEQPEHQRGDARDSTEVDHKDWFGGRSQGMHEEVVGLGRYGRVLTLFTCPDVLDEAYRDEAEECDSDEALQESWTPRWR